jgi:SAM-dependent methyltransferase
MHLTELQRNWDAFGHIDPLWAILTDPRLRGNKWNSAEFFSTGQQEVAELMDQAARLGVPRHRRWALDFGCGVGRLTQALAEYFQQTVGLDIAPSMIDLARRYNAHGSRCEYAVNDTDDLSRFADGTFDLVFTGRVLQHVAPPYAENYIREFVRVLAPGGYLSFDVPSEHGLFAADGTAQPAALAAIGALFTS